MQQGWQRMEERAERKEKALAATTVALAAAAAAAPGEPPGLPLRRQRTTTAPRPPTRPGPGTAACYGPPPEGAYKVLHTYWERWQPTTR